MTLIKIEQGYHYGHFWTLVEKGTSEGCDRKLQSMPGWSQHHDEHQILGFPHLFLFLFFFFQVNTKFLAPLFLAYDDRLKEKDQMIKTYDVSLLVCNEDLAVSANCSWLAHPGIQVMSSCVEWTIGTNPGLSWTAGERNFPLPLSEVLHA